MYVTQNINSTNIISTYTIQISNTNKKWELNWYDPIDSTRPKITWERFIKI